MGDEHLLPVTALRFFDDPAALELFAKLDYQLKDGMHFQQWKQQRPYFDFIQKHEHSLKAYYEQYFAVRLEYGGEGPQRYYYLDFNPGDRGRIDGDHRYFLKPEYVILGLLIYKIIYIDRNVELNSVRQLQNMIRTDYEEFRDDLYRVIAKLRKTTPGQLGNGKIDDVVADTLREFKKLGWVDLDGDYFDSLPAFFRLQKLYSEQINRIDELLKSH